MSVQPPDANAKKRLGLKKGEVHKEKFEDDAERWKEAQGYMIIFFCNALSCVAVALYLAGLIDPPQELRLEIVFLFVKGVIEVVTGKFSWELLLHHTAMLLGFGFNQASSMRCWAFITVHQQFVHVPFAIRALWRLTLPSLGYISSETSWRRRGLINMFWITWFFIVGYRTSYIVCYCLNGWFKLKLGWEPAMGMCMAAVLANLDRSWSKAMWPKPGGLAGPSQLKSHLVWFHVGTRSMFVAGFLFAVLSVVSDVAPEILPSEALRVRFLPHFSKSTLQCLAE